MLNEIRKMITDVLEVSSADVIKTREALLAEQATEDARYAATSALNHPEGSTTPIEEAYSRAQDRVAVTRKQVEKVLPKAMALMMAMEIAEQRREEARLHREQGWSRPAAEQDVAINRAAASWFPRLRRHGVHPHYLKQHSNETVAIISDLIIWKAKDPKFSNPDNPWRRVLGIYATRKIDKPLKKGRSGASKSGVPKVDRHNMGIGDYRFDEMVSAAWGVHVATIEPEPIEPPPMPTFDCSIYAEDLPATAIDVAEEGEPDVLEQLEDDTLEPETEALDDVGDEDEYALPSHIEAEGAAKLRAAALKLADDGAFDESMDELKWAMGDGIEELSDDEVVARVEGKSAPAGCTPYAYFVETARLNGRDAGMVAYREATIRRIMLTIATDPIFADARKRLSLE
jgi:hypothetical protein